MVLEKATKIDDQDKSALFLLALSYQNREKYPKAIRLYEKLISMRPVKKEVYYNLGVSYGRKGRLAFAHYYFWIYFKELGKERKADFHFRKAKELSSDDPAVRSRIEKTKKAP